MRRFALIFRMDILSSEAQPSPEQMQVYMESWAKWIAGIESDDRLEGGNHFMPSGTLLRRGRAAEDTPYVAEKQSVAGYILVRARDLDDALRIARQCPILEGEGTSVEVREAASGPNQG